MRNTFFTKVFNLLCLLFNGVVNRLLVILISHFIFFLSVCDICSVIQLKDYELYKKYVRYTTQICKIWPKN